jgi:ribonuclease HI
MKVVYTDGSCIGNETKDESLRRAGIGIYFPEKPEFNVSEKLNMPPNTNIRAEMYAIVRAILIVLTHRDYFEKTVLIKTDSKFSIDLVTKWLEKWKKNGFKKANKKPVENKDLVILLDNTLEQAKSQGYTIKFEHVYAHKSEPKVEHTNQKWIDWYCNSQVDQLALRGGTK